jgi:hypothetical protein
MGHAAGDFDPGQRDITELIGIVGRGIDGFGKVFADLVLIDIDSGHKLDIINMIAAQVDMHEPGDGIGIPGIAVVIDSLDQGRRTVPYPDDCNIDFSHYISSYYLSKNIFTY